MKPAKATLALVLALAGIMASEPVLARGRGGGGHGGKSGGHASHGHRSSHARSTVIIGGAVFMPYYYQPQYAPVVVQPAPWGYIEQGGDWYYCAESKKYFPDAQECPGSWQLITPAPAPPEHRQAIGTADSPIP